jgi:hypothetical protein
MWLLLSIFAASALELWGGSHLARNNSDVLAWASWLKALLLLASAIAYIGSFSPISVFLGGVVFVVGIVCLTNHHDRIRATRSE